MRRFFLTLLTAIISMAVNAQQWEIDFGDPESYTALSSGIVNDQGEAVFVGNYGPDENHYYPLIMRVSANGEYDYRIFDTIVGNVRLTHIVQQGNGTYFASAVVQPNNLGVGEEVVFLLLDANLNIISVKRYEKPEMVLGLRGGRLMLDDDGTVVFSCAYWYQTTYGQRTKPCFYRFDVNADTLSCSYVTGTLPSDYDCYQLLQTPNDNGFVVLCAGLNGKCSLLMYDHDFNYEDGFILSPAFRQSFAHAYSDHWLSDNRLLILGDMWPFEEYTRWNIGMADVGLDGTFDRWDRVYHKQDTAIQSSSQCMAYVNDSTIYGGAWFYKALGGERHASVCLYDTDMEMLGRKDFVESEYGSSSCCSVLPMKDGGCLACLFLDGGYSYKLIKLSREDLNPIPCSVKDVPNVAAIEAAAYPNPATTELNIDISGLPENKEHRVQISDAMGRVCMDRIIRGEGNVLTVGISTLKPGVYIYTIYNTENDVVKNKFIKE